MPPILNSLGPITDWLSGMLFKGFRSKYEDVSKATSSAKVGVHKAAPVRNCFDVSEWEGLCQGVGFNSDVLGPASPFKGSVLQNVKAHLWHVT